jgi:hypothetical protein
VTRDPLGACPEYQELQWTTVRTHSATFPKCRGILSKILAKRCSGHHRGGDKSVSVPHILHHASAYMIDVVLVCFIIHDFASVMLSILKACSGILAVMLDNPATCPHIRQMAVETGLLWIEGTYCATSAFSSLWV